MHPNWDIKTETGFGAALGEIYIYTYRPFLGYSPYGIWQDINSNYETTF
jgi:hypothetical protein